MAISKEEFFSLLDAQKLEFELQREIDIENHRREIKDINCRLRKEVEEHNEDVTLNFGNLPNSPNPSVQEEKLNRIKSAIARVLGIEKFSAMSDLNTETISMYSVAKVVDINSNKIWKMVIALEGLIFVCVQLSVMGYALTETSLPACHSMTDCPFGTYCKGRYKTPTCADCADFANKTQYFEEFCPSVSGENDWNELDLFEDLDHGELWVKPGTGYNRAKCYGFKHCINTDLDVDNNFRGHCDFVALNKYKMDGRTWLSLIFLGFLWSLPICQDIEEATIEEQVLNHHIAESFSFPAEIVLLTLRIRRWILPFVTTSTTISLIVTGDVSAKNIILNFLTITFITESDNILAFLFLQTHHKELMENSVKHIKIESLPDLKLFIYWSRIQGFTCVFVLLIGLASIYRSVDNCDDAQFFFWDIAFFPSMFVLMVQGFYRIYTKKGEETVFHRIISALIEVSRNYTASTIPTCFKYLLDYFFLQDDTFFTVNPVQTYALTAISYTVFIGLYIFKRKCLMRMKPINNKASLTPNES